MQLHEVTSHNRKRVQRKGRGGKRGTTSGRGTKGQKSRSGHVIRPALRDLIIRLPKHRGFRNKPKSAPAEVVNLSALVKKAALHAGTVVDRMFLKTVGLIPAGYKGEVKVLGKAEVKQAITIKGIKISKGVALQIEKAGGKIEA